MTANDRSDMCHSCVNQANLQTADNQLTTAVQLPSSLYALW